MSAVTGITGRVGGGAGRTLLNAGLTVRAVVRNAAKGVAWKERGCEVALADMKDAPALTAAFTGVNGAFVLIPSNFDPTPGLTSLIQTSVRASWSRRRLGRTLPGNLNPFLGTSKNDR
jgi:NAD(P)H dehydrogenase (quinone)